VGVRCLAAAFVPAADDRVRNMSILDGLGIWVSSNLLLAALLVWHRDVIPQLVRWQFAAHLNAARGIDDFRGIVWR
jgi:hypothetical protein